MNDDDFRRMRRFPALLLALVPCVASSAGTGGNIEMRKPSRSAASPKEGVFRGDLDPRSPRADALADLLLRRTREARETGNASGGRVTLDLTVRPHPGVPWLDGRALLLANSRPGAPGWSIVVVHFVCNLPVASADVVREPGRLRLQDEFFLEGCSEVEPGKWLCQLLSATQSSVNVEYAPESDPSIPEWAKPPEVRGLQAPPVPKPAP